MTINVIFSENVRFSRSYQFSLVIMNGSRLIAGCFRFIFGSRYAESTRSKFGVSAYSRINTVIVCFQEYTAALFLRRYFFRQKQLTVYYRLHVSYFFDRIFIYMFNLLRFQITMMVILWTCSAYQNIMKMM